MTEKHYSQEQHRLFRTFWMIPALMSSGILSFLFLLFAVTVGDSLPLWVKFGVFMNVGLVMATFVGTMAQIGLVKSAKVNYDHELDQKSEEEPKDWTNDWD